MAHLAMPEQWSFRGTDLSTYAYLVRQADGVDDHPPLRGDDRLVPSATGRRFARKRHDARRLALALWVMPLNAAGARDLSTDAIQARANLDALNAILADRSAGALVRTMPDGSTRTAQAEVVSVGDILDDDGHEMIGLTVDFLLADPFFHGPAASVTQAIAASPTDFTVTNAGSVANPKPVITFSGPITNPRLANLSIDAGGGFHVECLVTVAAAKLLVIDCGAWTALNDGVNAIGSVRHSGAFEFFRLEPGANSLRVTSTSPGGSVRLDYSPSYL